MVATVSESSRLSEDELDELFGVTEPILAVKVQGNTFPRWSDSQPSHPEKPLHIEVVNEARTADLSQRLESSLWKTMPIALLDVGSDTTLDDLIRAYNSSLNRIHLIQDDLRPFIRSICAANVEWRSEDNAQVPYAQQDAIESTINEMAARVTHLLGPSASVLTAEVTTWPIETVRKRFTESIRKELQHFCRSVESSLKEMAELQLIGIVEWVGPGACKYHFFTEVLCHDGTVTVDSGPMSREPWERRSNFLFRYYNERTKTALISKRRARHEHHVIRAFHTSVANTSVTKLPRHKQLLDAIPDWLSEFVRVIDGSLVRERVIEQEYCRKSWSEVEVTKLPLEFDLPIFTIDPAIVIDQYALSGWGIREIQQEQQRQVEERTTISRTSSDVEWRWWLTGVIPAAVAFMGTAGSRPDLWPLAILALTICMFSVIQTVALLERAGKEKAGIPQYVTSLTTTFATCGAGALLISCLRSPQDTSPWWFILGCFAVCSGIAMCFTFDTLKSFIDPNSNSSR